MAVQIVSSETISGDTFYRNRAFDISFSVTGPGTTYSSLYFSNSTGSPTSGVLSYVSNDHFKSTSGVSTVGSLGTLSVDVITDLPQVVTSVTSQSYVGASGVCTDPAGNVYFAVMDQNRVFRRDPSGNVTTFAGTGVTGGLDGPRLTAQFSSPNALATDGAGTFYVTDNYRVRKIDPAGNVSTLAGSSIGGYADGTGASARFGAPASVAIDPSGNVIVSDEGTVLRKITPTGVVSTYAGVYGPPSFDYLPVDGSLNSTPVPFNQIRGVASGPDPFYDLDAANIFAPTWTTTSNGFVEVIVPFTPIGTIYAMAATPGGRIVYGGNVSRNSITRALWYEDAYSSGEITPSYTNFSISAVYSLAYNGTYFVAVGENSSGSNYPVYSTDGGPSWTTANAMAGANFPRRMWSIAYGDGVWIAAGQGGDFSGGGGSDSSRNFVVSTDVSSWSPRFGTGSNRIPDPIRRVVYGGGRWLMMSYGTSSNLMTSTDSGDTWTMSTSPLDTGVPINDITYGNGTWVLVGNNSASLPDLFYSSDVSTWTGVSTSSMYLFGPATTLYYSAMSNLFFAFDSNSKVAISSNALEGDWIISTAPAVVKPMVDLSFNKWTPGTARINNPRGLLYDASGTLYIAGGYEAKIRSVPAGSNVMTTFAGSGSGEISNGTLLTAGIGAPTSLAQDSSGILYIGGFSTIQTMSGNNISLLAGAQYQYGYVDGAPLSARFNGLTGLATVGNALYISDFNNGVLRSLVTSSEVRPGANRPPGYTIIATSNYPIVINSRIDVSWSSVGGSLPLYKYEPFFDTFTARGTGNTLAYTATSSTELLGYLSGAGTSNVQFRGPNGASVAYPYTLTLAVQALSNGIVYDSVSTNVTISAGRIITTPCNSNLVFYRNEPSPNPVFSLVSSPAQLVYSATTLPAGLSFVKTASNAFTLTGTPTIQSITSNYTILAQDTSGRTYSTPVTMVVNPERLIIDVSGSLALTGLTSNDPIAPITFTSRFPPYTNPDRAVTYSWFPAPPAGLQFKRKDGTAVFGLSQSIVASTDPSFALTLSGTITSAQLLEYASNGVTSASLVFNGVRTNGGGLLSPAIPKTITVSFAEFIHFSSNVPSLYVGRAVSNLFYSARTYFPVVDSSITSIEIIDGFIPDGLDASFTPATQRFSFVGTPTFAGSYGFTLQATNGQGLSVTLPVTMTPSNDSVVITTTADSCFNFIQYRPLTSAKSGFYTSSIRYTAAAASGSSVTVVGANLPAGVTLVPISAGVYELQGVPTAASTLTTATLTGTAQGTGAVGLKTFLYSVSAEVFTFNDLSLAVSQNIPITPAFVTATTLSEQPILRYSAPALPSALQIANTGKLTGTPLGDTSGTFDVTAYTAYSSGTNPYSYSMTPDQVLLLPSVPQTITAPGCNVSIPITGYSLSATTVGNFRFQDPFPYGLTVNPTTGLLSGTLSSTLPATVDFTVLGNAGNAVGSLDGQMLTYDQSVIRNNILGRFNQSNLRVYSWPGVGNMTTIVSSNNMTAARIGINGTGTFLIPTSSDTVLRSTTGQSYTSVPLGQSTYTPLMTGILYDAVSSTWWMGGTLLDGTRSVYVFKSTTDGLTWDSGTLIPGLQDRSGNASPGSGVYNAYLYGGVDLASRDGILLVGGQQIARSSTGGTAWTTPSSSLIEVARFSLEQGTVWLAVGSSLYSSASSNTYTADATTIVYSLDQGETWNDAPGGFNMNAYEVVYGDGVWLASGLDWTGTAFVGRIRYSFDGLTWAILTSIPSYTYASTSAVLPTGFLGGITYAESEWTVVSPNPSNVTGALVYTHPVETPIDAGWTVQSVGHFGLVGQRLVSFAKQSVDPGPDRTIIQFVYGVDVPTFVSPAQSTYVAWQYMPLPPITFSATGVFPISYFVSSLPVGLTWDPATLTVTGSAVQLGTHTFTVYAVYTGSFSSPPLPTSFTVTLIVEVPRIVKQQTGAGAYTSLVRQYTTVNAAQNARDTRAFPTQVSGIGEFASPYPPDVITPSNCPC